MKTWYFTFGMNCPLEGYCQPIKAKSYRSAREKMFELHGNKWAFQYSEKEWLQAKEDLKYSPLSIEKELSVIEA